MEIIWKSDLYNTNEERIQILISVLAYMDDTTWITTNQKDLEHIISIADEFYDLNNIKINKSKSILLTNSTKFQDTVDLKFGNNIVNIKPKKISESVRFLGVWINLANKKSFVYNQILELINNYSNLIRYKPMTDKQLCYVYNAVILPIIEYRSQLTLFSKEECHKLFTHFRILFKNKFKYSKTIPNALLECRRFYDIKDIWFI